MATDAILAEGEPRVGRETLLTRYQAVRGLTQRLCSDLATEDYLLQPMPDASPVKWHLAHTAWFFETFVLKTHCPEYEVFQPEFERLFNSYYNAVGPRWPRHQRGLLSRPTVEEVYAYRRHVDEAVTDLLQRDEKQLDEILASVVELGLQHEQQHQELIITDLKNAFALNPLDPIYRGRSEPVGNPAPPADWVQRSGGLVAVGHRGGSFAFDNEGPRHRVFLRPYQLGNRLVTNEEYLAFMVEGGYERPEFWLSDGWATRQARGWEAPLYWEQDPDGWYTRTMSGRQPVDPAEPVCHVSYYEADAFARWAGARLPTEFEWEAAAACVPIAGYFLDAETFHPVAGVASDDAAELVQLYGHVWQWTASPYSAYPGYKPASGALGEYNGKFMCNQVVLRGASCATPRSHARPTYRNFFGPDARWQYSGIRLAGDCS